MLHKHYKRLRTAATRTLTSLFVSYWLRIPIFRWDDNYRSGLTTNEKVVCTWAIAEPILNGYWPRWNSNINLNMRFNSCKQTRNKQEQGGKLKSFKCRVLKYSLTGEHWTWLKIIEDWTRVNYTKRKPKCSWHRLRPLNRVEDDQGMMRLSSNHRMRP